MPASAMTTSLPRPSSVSGIPRDRAKRTIARSSWTLWTVAKRSAGPPTRIVVNRASGSSRDVFTPIRRWIAVPIATASKAAPDPCSVGRGRGHASDPREIRSISSAVGSGRRSAAAMTSAATASAAPGRPKAARRLGHRGAGGVVGQRAVRGRDERVGVERLVGDDPGRAGVGEDPGVRASGGPRRGDTGRSPTGCRAP